MKHKISKSLLLSVGTALFINGVSLSIFANLNTGVILTILLGAFLIAWGIFYKSICEITKNGMMKYIKYTAVTLLSAELLLVAFIAGYGQLDNVTYTEDAVIVLGAGIRGDKVTLTLKQRLDTAIGYHNKNPDSVIVVTGGQGFQEIVTEASAMEKYLIENGIDKSRIIKEEKATSTNENMRFSKAILDECFDSNYKIAVVTNNFHIFRGTSIARIEGFENVTHIHGGLMWYNLVPCYLRESLAVIKMWILG